MKKTRRQDRAVEEDEAMEVLRSGEYGVLSTVGENGQPYGVPLSYATQDDCIYFHCAKIGHKLENIENNSRVSFTVVGRTKILPDKFATEYESAIVFGVASEILGAEREGALLLLLEKYSKEFMAEGKAYIKQKDLATKVIKVRIEHLSGKARK